MLKTGVGMKKGREDGLRSTERMDGNGLEMLLYRIAFTDRSGLGG